MEFLHHLVTFDGIEGRKAAFLALYKPYYAFPSSVMILLLAGLMVL